MGWEVFNRRDGRHRRGALPAVSVGSIGRLTFNARARDIIASVSPEMRVMLLFDCSAKRFAFRPTSDANSYKVSRNGQVFARGFVEHAGVQLFPQRFLLSWDADAQLLEQVQSTSGEP
jgi:hypothetical protein